MTDTISIQFYDKNKTPIQLPRSGVDTTTPLRMVGLFSRGYAENINQAIFNIFEAFAAPQPPPNPVQGQLWFNNATQRLNVATSVSPIVWKELGPFIAGSQEPIPPGPLWYDITVPQLKVFDGTSYVSVAENYLLLTGGTVTGNVTSNGGIDVPTATASVPITINDGILSLGDVTFADGASITTGTNAISFDHTQDSIDITSDGSVIFNAATTLSGSLSTNDNYFDVSSLGNFYFRKTLQLNNNNIAGVVQNLQSSTSLVPYSQLQQLESSLPQYVSLGGDSVDSLQYNRPIAQGNYIDVDTLTFADSAGGGSVSLISAGTVLTIQHDDTLTPLLSYDVSSGSLNVHGNFVETLTAHWNNNQGWTNTVGATKAFIDTEYQKVYTEKANLNNKSQAAAWVVFNVATGAIVNSYNILSVVKTIMYFDVTFASPQGLGTSEYVAIPTFINPPPTSGRVGRYHNLTHNISQTVSRVFRTQETFIGSYGKGGDDTVWNDYGSMTPTNAGALYISVAYYV